MTQAADREALIRDYGSAGNARSLLLDIDWATHSLGRPDTWTVGLRLALRNMFASPEPLYLFWGEERSFFFNDACTVVLGPRIDGFMAQPFGRIWEDSVQVEPMVRKALAGIGTKITDVLLRSTWRGQEEDSWWDISYAPLYDVDGTVGGMQGLANETTRQVLWGLEQKRVTEALAASERSLRRAQEAGRVGVFAIDVGSSTLTATPEFFRLFGLPEADTLPAREIEKLVLPEDQSQVSHDDGRVLQSIPLHVEYRIRRPDNGEIRCIERRAEFERDADGHAVRLVGVVQDVTQERDARDALAALNATLEARVKERTAERNLLATIVEETDAIVHALDTDYRWLAFNEAATLEFERLFGRRPIIGESMIDMIVDQPETRSIIEATWARALAGEEFSATATIGGEGRIRERLSYEMKFNTLRDDEGNRVGAFQLVNDITERVRAEAAIAEMQEALRQSQKMEAMGQLTGGVAHDFNNLLTPIIGGLDRLQRRDGLSDREARLIDGALQSAERAKTLVQRLLAFARRQPLQAGAVDMRALVDGMADLVASTSGPQIEIRTEIADRLPAAMADPNQLEMAILNLCVNARDAMPDGGTITIAARAEPIPADCTDAKGTGLHMRLSVIDTGVGMDETTRLRAIEPFYSTKGVGKGTGLGLSMVHGLVMQLGGAMTISSAPGFGTRIDLWLPLSDELALPPEGAPTVPRPTVRGRVLVVDDEVLVRIATIDMLENLGYETEEADSAVKAEARLRAGENFDLVVTDHLMPGVTGAELAATIRRHWPALPVLIASGYADVEAIAPGIPRLTKPFREAELAQAIAGLR